MTRMLGLLFMTLYVIGTAPVELMHSFSHDHNAPASHSQEQEKDPCHRLLYHNDVETGCDHDLHLTGSDKCDMCDLVHPGDQIFLFRVDTPKLKFSDQFFDTYKLSLDTHWAVISSSRAPPVLI
jgi:hypothetical protein